MQKVHKSHFGDFKLSTFFMPTFYAEFNGIIFLP